MKTQLRFEKQEKVLGVPFASSWTHVVRGTAVGTNILILAKVDENPLNGADIMQRLLGIKSFKLNKGALCCHCFKELPSLTELASFEKELGSFDIIIELKSTPFNLSHLPQVTTSLADNTMQDIAHEFGAPILINACKPPEWLNHIPNTIYSKWLVYELGQSPHTNELSVWAGVKGLLNVMTYMGMIRCQLSRVGTSEPFVAYHSHWLNAQVNGLIQERVKLNDTVETGDILATVHETGNNLVHEIISPIRGVIIGKQNSASVNIHSALYHIASVADISATQNQIAKKQNRYYPKKISQDMALQVPFVF